MNIAIVGSGLGGLATAAKLIGKHKIDVYEKEALIGGRALTLDGINENYKKMIARFEMANAFASPPLNELYEIADGYKIDLGFHLIGGGKNGACVRALKEINAGINFIGSRLGYIGEKIEYPMLSSKDKMKMLPRIMQLLFSRPSTIEAMKKMSIEEAIKIYGRGKLKTILEIFPRLISTVNDLSKISAGETLFSQRELLGGSPVVYPIGGLKSISNAFAEYIKKNGGKIFTERRVKNIDIDNNKAVGVDGKIYDAVIIDMPVQKIFSIVKEKHFPARWVKKIKGLKPTGSMVAYHAFNKIDEKLMDKSFVFIEKNDGFDGNAIAGMIDFKMANPIAGLSPEKKYLIQSYAICSPEEAKNRKKWDELISVINKNLEKLIHGYEKNVEWEIYNTIWHLDGVAKTIDNEKPDVRTPIKNLYLAGDSVNSKGVGINCAIDSANLIRL